MLTYRRSLSLVSALFLLFMLLVSCSNRERNNRKESQLLPGDTAGLVVKIVDGDTYDILVNRKTYRIRMNGIDAPERGQPYYQKSKDYLGSLCFQRKIKVVKLDVDRHCRTIAESFLDDSINLSYEMVKAGYAWHYKKYSKDSVAFPDIRTV